MKKWVVLLCSLLITFTIIGFSAGALTGAWHPLQQVSTDSAGSASVDEDANGRVDDSDRVGGLTAASLSAAGTSATKVVAYIGSGSCASGFDYLAVSGGTGQLVITQGLAFSGGTTTSLGAGATESFTATTTSSGAWCVKTGVSEIKVYTTTSAGGCQSGYTQTGGSSSSSSADYYANKKIALTPEGIAIGFDGAIVGSPTQATIPNTPSVKVCIKTA